MLAPEVSLDLVAVAPMGTPTAVPENVLQKDQVRAEQLGRMVTLLPEKQPPGPELVQLAREGNYNVIVLPWSEESRAFSETPPGEWIKYVLHSSPCSVFLASHPVIPRSRQRNVDWADFSTAFPQSRSGRTSLTVRPQCPKLPL